MGLNLKVISRVICLVTVFLGAVMIIPAAVSFMYNEIVEARVFGFSSIFLLVFGGTIFFTVKSPDKRLKTRDGIITVSLIWIITVLLGAVPFSVILDISFIDALFESTSGFTTTGASVLADIESLPAGLLFWRSFTNWLGGLGIIILVIAIFPLLSGSGQALVKAESNRTRSDKISSKYTDNAKRLFFYYIIMTIACALLLLPGSTDLFTSINTAMSTVSTGGFTIGNSNMTELGNPYIYWILILFMTLGSINFALYYYLFSSHWREFFRDLEIRWYLLIIITGTVFITLYNFFAEKFVGLFETFTHAAFNFVSILSTTGFYSDNYNLWSTFAQTVLFIAMFTGGCSASTAGGIKTFRIMVAYKLIKRNLSRRLHPNAVVSIKNDEGPLRTDFVSAIAAYIFMYILVIFVGTLILSIDNKEFVTTLSAVIACTGNIGPGFEAVGPLGNYSLFSWWGKLLLCANMLIGRLELFGIILLTTRRFWNPNRYKA